MPNNDDCRATLAPRWYVLDRDGLATLCASESDAESVAAHALAQWPQRGPYRVALLGDVRAATNEIERLRAAIARACAGYPADDAAPTCVAILRDSLGSNVEATGKPPRGAAGAR
jgi:hypothetical protein